MQQDLRGIVVNQYNPFINQHNSLHLSEKLSQSCSSWVKSNFAARRGRHMMRASIRPSTISRLAGADAALWLCGAGSAWAATGGGDLGSLQAVIGPPDGSSGFCNLLGMGPKSAPPLGPTANPCPQIPTVTQAVLAVAGLTNSPPEAIRAQNSIPPRNAVTAANVAAVPPDDPLPINNSTSSPPLFLPGNATTPASGLLTTLTPIAFASQHRQISTTAAATPLSEPSADTFLYAVGVSSKGAVNAAGLTDPDKVYFIYEDLFRNNQTFTNNQIVAKFSFPLTFLNNDGSESPVMTTLQVTATCNGGPSCLKAQAVGGIGTPQNSVDASQLGIQFALVFSGSPTLANNHAIFEVAVPLLVTGACVAPHPVCKKGQTPPSFNTDPGYNYFQHFGAAGPINTAIFTAFGNGGDDLGATPTQSGILPSGAFSVGLAPSAAPLCTTDALGNVTCPSTISFALCASLPDNTNGPNADLRPAVGAYYAITTNGEVLLSAPLPSVSVSSCQL
jgi:hypothetical protein